MSFRPTLPTFNESVLIYRYDSLLEDWVADAEPTLCQHYGPRKENQLVWVDYFTITRPGPPAYQLGPIAIYFLFPYGTGPSDPFDTQSGKTDYFVYDHPPFPARTYWVDQVEPRWAGFPNEHVWAYCTRRLVVD